MMPQDLHDQLRTLAIKEADALMMPAVDRQTGLPEVAGHFEAWRKRRPIEESIRDAIAGAGLDERAAYPDAFAVVKAAMYERVAVWLAAREHGGGRA